MVPQIVQDRVALVARDADDALGEAAVDIERLLAGHRMRADHRMFGARIGRLVGNAEVGIGAAIGVLAVMDRGEAFQVALHPIGQRLIGRVHRGEQRVAAARRALADIQDAAHRRFHVAGHVAVPAFTVGARRVLVGVDDHQFRMARLVRRGGMDVQLAEAATEVEVLLVADVLVAEEDHQVLRQRAMDFLERLVAERLREIDAADLRADDRRQLVDRDRVVRRRLVGVVLVARSVVATQDAHGRSPSADRSWRGVYAQSLPPRSVGQRVATSG